MNNTQENEKINQSLDNSSGFTLSDFTENPDEFKQKTQNQKVEVDLKKINKTGKKKSSVANVRFSNNNSQTIRINNKDLNSYFQHKDYELSISKTIELCGFQKDYGLVVKTSGGGKSSQCRSICQGIASLAAIVKPELKEVLKKLGLLKFDARKVERKKCGRIKARKDHPYNRR